MSRCRCWATAAPWHEPGRARMHAAAALPEAGGDRAQPVAARSLRERAHRRQPCAWREPWTTRPGHLRVPGGRAVDRAAIRLHRGQPAPAGRAHGDRSGDRRSTWCSCRSQSRPAQTLGRARPRRRHRRRRSAALRSSGASMPRRSTPRATRGRPAARSRASTCPSGPGVRVDSHGYAAPRAIAALRHAAGQADRARASAALRRRACAGSRRALAECRIDGLADQPGLAAGAGRAARVRQRRMSHTRFLEAHLPSCWPGQQRSSSPSRTARPRARQKAARRRRRLPGRARARWPRAWCSSKSRWRPTSCRPARRSAVLEAMKMEHLLHAPQQRARRARCARRRATTWSRARSCWSDGAGRRATPAWRRRRPQADLDAIRPDLQQVIDRHAPTLDANRAAAVARRHAAGGRTARENVADLCDAAAASSSTARSPSPPRRGRRSWTT